MLPAAFVFMDKLILTPNGKVDRNALPPPELEDVADRDFVAPRTPLETQLAELCAQVLGLNRVGMHDNFFDIGGHSLAAAQLTSRIRETIHVDLSLGKLFDSPTMSALAEYIQVVRTASAGSAHASALPSLAPSVIGSAMTSLSTSPRSSSPLDTSFTRPTSLSVLSENTPMDDNALGPVGDLPPLSLSRSATGTSVMSRTSTSSSASRLTAHLSRNNKKNSLSTWLNKQAPPILNLKRSQSDSMASQLDDSFSSSFDPPSSFKADGTPMATLSEAGSDAHEGTSASKMADLSIGLNRGKSVGSALRQARGTPSAANPTASPRLFPVSGSQHSPGSLEDHWKGASVAGDGTLFSLFLLLWVVRTR